MAIPLDMGVNTFNQIYSVLYTRGRDAASFLSEESLVILWCCRIGQKMSLISLSETLPKCVYCV